MNAIIVSGGAGFIGSAVCRYLVAETDFAVVNVDKLTYAANPASLADIDADPRYRFVRGDIGDRAGMDADLIHQLRLVRQDRFQGTRMRTERLHRGLAIGNDACCFLGPGTGRDGDRKYNGSQGQRSKLHVDIPSIDDRRQTIARPDQSSHMEQNLPVERNHEFREITPK